MTTVYHAHTFRRRPRGHRILDLLAELLDSRGDGQIGKRDAVLELNRRRQNPQIDHVVRVGHVGSSERRSSAATWVRGVGEEVSLDTLRLELGTAICLPRTAPPSYGTVSDGGMAWMEGESTQRRARLYSGIVIEVDRTRLDLTMQVVRVRED